jgi:hypothetical protein
MRRPVRQNRPVLFCIVIRSRHFVSTVICHSGAPVIRHCFRKVCHNVEASVTSNPRPTCAEE